MVDDSCMVCFEEIIDKCTLKCSHFFCKRCLVEILKEFLFELTCPYCRQECMIYEIKDGDNFLFSKPDTIAGGVYIQGSIVGLASYHFDSVETSYISYESPQCNDWPNLDDGSRPAEKKYFQNPNYDAVSRTFIGTIDWSPTSWDNDKLWKYTMVFSEDFMTIDSGSVEHFTEIGGNRIKETLFGIHLIYCRQINLDQ